MILTDAIFGRKKAQGSETLDISTAVFYQEMTNIISPALISGLRILDNGTKLFYADKFARKVFKHEFGTPYDINSLTYIGSTPQLHYSLYGVWISPDGLNLFTSAGPTLYNYTLSSPWDLASAVLNKQKALSQSTTDFYFTPDGLKLFSLSNASPDTILQHYLTIPWDISSVVFEKNPIVVSGISMDINLSEDGKYIFVIQNGVNMQFELETPYETDTVIDIKSFTSGASVESCFVATEVKKLYIADTNTQKIAEYDFN